MNDIILRFIAGHPRTKIILTRYPLDGFVWVDLGREFSKLLQPILHHRLMRALANDSLTTFIMDNTEELPIVGNYIALKNTGILFEPELQIDIRSILEQWGKEQMVLFQLSPNAQIEDDKVYLSKYNRSFYFDLKGLNYITID